MSNKIYFDLEFSDLKASALLISAAFITEQNESLYIEVEDSFWKPKASQFVLDVVCPLLSRDGLPASDVAAKIVGWIRGRGPDVTLISDSSWDRRILLKHLRDAGYCKPMWQWDQVPSSLTKNQHRTFELAYAEWFLRSKKAQHHAFHDAQALRSAHMVALYGNE